MCDLQNKKKSQDAPRRVSTWSFYWHLKYTFDDGGHVVVLVFGKAAAKDNVLFLSSESAVLVGKTVVTVVVHGIVGLHALGPLGGVLARDDGLGTVIDGLSEHLEVLVLDDAGIGDGSLGVVDDGVALVVRGVEQFLLETHGAVVEFAEAEAVELVDGSG